MSRYRHEIDNARAHIISLWLVIIVLAIGMAYAFRGWANAPSDITLHIPPDLSSGALVRVGEIPKPNVYGFGYYMWQQLNRWPRDGATLREAIVAISSSAVPRTFRPSCTSFPPI